MSEIEKVVDQFERSLTSDVVRSLTSDVVCSEKTDVNSEIAVKSIDFREIVGA